MKRKEFIKKSSVGMAGFFIVPRHILGGRHYTGANDRLQIAAIGAGGKATANITNAYNDGTDSIVSLCDVDDRMAAEMRRKHGKATYYRDYRQMLDREDKNIDAVIVTTPDHMHAPMALAAMERGKHVYVEKPLTHDIYEARQLTEAAVKYQVVTQMGNQGSSGDDTRRIATWVEAGLIGDVHTVHVWTNRPVWPQGIPTPKGKFKIPPTLDWNLWLGTAPKRDFHPSYLPAQWRGWVDFGTGALGDMGCHFIDVPFMALKLGYPEAVECSAGRVWTGFFEEAVFTDCYPPSAKIHLLFPARGNQGPLEMIWYDGGITPKRPPELLPDEVLAEWDGGILMEGTGGKIMAGLFGRNPTLLPTRLMKEVQLPEITKPLVPGGINGHQQQWVQACKVGYGAETSSPFSIAGPLTETVLMGNLAIRSFNYRQNEKTNDYPGRKKLLWDGVNMKITNFAPANDLVRRTYRKY